ENKDENPSKLAVYNLAEFPTRFIIKKYGVSNFHFEDDNISFDEMRFEKILDKIIQRKLTIKWDTPNGIRADSLNYEILKKIKQTGCQELTISIESGNQKVLDEIIKKSTKLDRILEVVKICRKLKIRLGAFYVIGFPGETKENIKQTTDLALNLFKTSNVIPHLLIATPLPGTKLYEHCLSLGILKEDFLAKNFSIAARTHEIPLFSTDDFSKEDLKKLFNTYRQSLKKASIIYSLKNPLYALKRIIGNPNLLKRILFFRQSS
ncbi:MAG: radical SAM protein, partial [Candidatus Omnitrophica bacterium]|nr:radical SAM protein [Candidatus Omnitrophota bacterium]